jgi:DNA mismatch repair ATPase MutS
MREALTIHGRDCFVPSMHELKEHNQSLIRTRAQVYFKTNEMREMDDHFGDIYGRISDREIEITHDLAQFVLHYKEVLISCSDICGELDRYVWFSS